MNRAGWMVLAIATAAALTASAGEPFNPLKSCKKKVSNTADSALFECKDIRVNIDAPQMLDGAKLSEIFSKVQKDVPGEDAVRSDDPYVVGGKSLPSVSYSSMTRKGKSRYRWVAIPVSEGKTRIVLCSGLERFGQSCRDAFEYLAKNPDQISELVK
ncbi:MAG: hypothetical protein JXR83_11015 [Deltaproteobacteria bacterium]|nr:hypothetical protein [Deltaproteobacteria bacterium]